MSQRTHMPSRRDPSESAPTGSENGALGTARRRRLLEPTAVALLLLLHWLLAVTSVLNKSTTYDEIAHATAGYSYWTTGDYRLNPENGNWPQRWMALPMLFQGYTFPALDQDLYRQSEVYRFGHQFFYTLGNDLDSLLRSGRAMMAVLSVALCLAVYLVSRRIFGFVGGIVSLLLSVFSPTLLANGPLMSSDVPAALAFFVSSVCFWLVLQRVTPLRLLGSVASTGALTLSKFSGVLILPVFLILAGVRLYSSSPLEVRLGRRRTVRRRAAQAGVIAWIALVHVAAIVVLVWASYGFRYEAFLGGRSEGAHFRRPWPTVVKADSATSKSIRFAQEHHLLPEAYVYGMAHVLTRSQARRSFLNGEYSETGWRSFFPFSLLVKTPISTLSILLLAALVAALRALRVERSQRRDAVWRAFYRTAPLWALLALYWAAALTTNLNIGHRHILPTYPPMFVLAGAAGWCFATRLHVIRAVVTMASLALAAESLMTWPDYLAYFNQLVGGPSKGYRHLVDSSLDWGQDLPGLKVWLDRRRGDNADRPVYLSYFGTGSPAFYGIEGRRLIGYPEWEPREPLVPLTAGTYCISASMLQSVYIRPWGHWNPKYEAAYRDLGGRVKAYSHADPEGREELAQSLGEDYLRQAVVLFDELRTARLFAYLRNRGEPDALIGSSILIYELTDQDIDRALHGPPPDPALSEDVRPSRAKASGGRA